jgi:hypothetical protein
MPRPAVKVAFETLELDQFLPSSLYSIGDVPVPVAINFVPDHTTPEADPENAPVKLGSQFIPSKLIWIFPAALECDPVATHREPFHATLVPPPLNPPVTALLHNWPPEVLYKIVFAALEPFPTATHIFLPLNATPLPELLNPPDEAFDQVIPSPLNF